MAASASVQLIIKAKAQLGALKDTLLGVGKVENAAASAASEMQELRARTTGANDSLARTQSAANQASSGMRDLRNATQQTGKEMEKVVRDRYHFGHLPKQTKDVAAALGDLGNSAEKAGSKADNGGGKLLNLYAGFGLLRGAILSARGAFAPFMEEMNRLGRLDDLKTITGESIKNLVLLERALENSGRSGSDIATIFRFISLAQEQAKETTSRQAKAFRALKIDLDEFAKLSPVGKVQALSSAIGKVEDPSRKAALAVRLLGESGVEYLPLLADGEGMSRAAHEVGELAEASERSAARMKRLGEDLGLLKPRIEEVLIELLERAAPVLETTARLIDRIPVEKLATGLTIAAGAAGVFGAALGVSRLMTWSAEIRKSIALLSAKASQYRAVGSAASAAGAKEAAANRGGRGRMSGAGKAVIGAAVVAGTYESVSELGSAVGKYNDAVNGADRSMLNMIAYQKKLADGVATEADARAQLAQVEMSLADVRKEQAAWFSSYSSKSLAQAERELQTLRSQLSAVNDQTLAANKLAAEEKERAIHAKAVAAAQKEAKESVTAIRDARMSANIGSTDGASRLAVLSQRAGVIGEDAGVGEASSPAALVQALERQIADVNDRLKNPETADQATEDLKKLKPFYEAALTLRQQYREQKKAIQDEENAEALALSRKQLEIERAQLDWSLERRKISWQKYGEARRSILSKQHEIDAQESNKGSDVAGRQLDREQLERELSNRKVNQPPLQSDRLARIGGTLGSEAGQSLNYARQSAEALTKNNRLLAELVSAVTRNSFTGGATFSQ